MQSIDRRISRLLANDAAPGVALIGAAVLALVVVNTGLAGAYDDLLATIGVWQFGAFSINKPLLLWINDGLMAVFFFFVGLEIKREVLEGRLSSARLASLPLAAAIGGVLVPALIYVSFNAGDAEAIEGWAIPAATDIAFALGVLALLGTRAPLALKIFLLAVAVIDDLIAIVIIALFYTENLSTDALLVAGLGIALLVTMNRLKIASLSPYLLIGVIVWAAVLKSGVHATLAGVAIALIIPNRDPRDDSRSPLRELEHWLKPWVLFLVMPVFAFANAGLPLSGLQLSDVLAPIPLGIALGLFVGKQVGIFSFTWVAVRLGLASLPNGLNWRHVYGVSLLAGVGFTMSLFIGTLAFDDPANQNAVRLAVLLGSLLSAVTGFVVLRFLAGGDRSQDASPERDVPAPHDLREGIQSSQAGEA